MRITLHWRGRPLLGLDVAAQHSDDQPPDRSLDPPMGLSAAPTLDTERAARAEPDTRVFGFGRRDEL